MILATLVKPICVCLSPCTKKCDVCGITLCEVTRRWKNACTSCASWFFKEVQIPEDIYSRFPKALTISQVTNR